MSISPGAAATPPTGCGGRQTRASQALLFCWITPPRRASTTPSSETATRTSTCFPERTSGAGRESEAGPQRSRRPESGHGRSADRVAGVREVLSGDEEGHSVGERARPESIQHEEAVEAELVAVVVELSAAPARLRAEGSQRSARVAKLRRDLVPRHLRDAPALDRGICG